MMEVVFEVGDPACPLTRSTWENPGVKGVFWLTESRGPVGLFRGVLTFTGDDDALAVAVKTVLNAEGIGDGDVMYESAGARVLGITWMGPAHPPDAGLPVHTAQALAHAFGPDTIVEPMALEEGRLRMRCVIPELVDSTDAIRKLQDMQQRMPVKHFRVIRVAELGVSQYADVLRRILTPEEEDLLRIAFDLGYYETPKRCTLEAIAQRVGLSVSPVHKRLKNVEQTLVNAHVNPQKGAPRPMRRRLARKWPTGTPPLNGGPRELAVRVRWPSYAATRITSGKPGTRVIVRPVEENAHRDECTSLLVVAASEPDYKPALAALEEHEAVRSVEAVVTNSRHALFKLCTTIPDAESWPTHPLPFTHILKRLGTDAFMKAVVVEDADVWMRFVVLRDTGANPGTAVTGAPVPVDDADAHPGAIAVSRTRRLPAASTGTPADAVARLTRVAEDARWEDMEIISLRSLSQAPALTGVKDPEKITPRQMEILKIAHALGYYKTPRECTLGDIARTLGISANAIHKNLTAAEQKIISGYLMMLD